MDKEILMAHGIDYREGIKRCMNDEVFYERFLSLFLQDDSLKRARVAFDKHDYRTLFRCMHEMKGMSSNAALVDLYDVVYPLVEILRNDIGSEQEIAERYALVEQAYNKAYEGITLALKKA